MSKNIFWVETEKAEFTFKTEAHQIINQIVFINVDRTQIDRKREKEIVPFGSGSQLKNYRHNAGPTRRWQPIRTRPC